MGSESGENIEDNHPIAPNRILAFSNTTIDVKQNNLGIVVAAGKSTRFSFAESNLGKAITSRETGYAEQARKYLVSHDTDSIVLNDCWSCGQGSLQPTPCEAQAVTPTSRLVRATCGARRDTAHRRECPTPPRGRSLRGRRTPRAAWPHESA